MIGESVTVVTLAKTSEDAHGDAIWTPTETTVSDVLVAPGPRNDIPDSERPAGTVVAFNLHFPKTFLGNLRGAQVRLRGELFDVIGDPRPYTVENTPTRWHMPAEVKRADG